MVAALQGVLLECDVPTKEFILSLNDVRPAKERFVIEDLDATRLFVQAKVTAWLEEQLALWQEKNTYQPPRREDAMGEITEADKAVLTLKTQRRKLVNEQKRLEGLVAREMQVARELVAKRQKERALLALKRRKLHEQQLERLGTWQLNVEQVLSNIEVAKQQNQLFAALKAGTKAIATMQKEVAVEDVERLMEDSAEAAAYQERMQDALAASLTPEQDEAAREELAGLEAAAEAEEADTIELPEVPKTRVEPAEVKPLPAKQAAEAEEPEEEGQLEEPIAAQ